jgi:hypothetical protein
VMTALGKCTACDEDALADAKGEPHIHPKLGVLLCERCYGRDTRVFELDVRALGSHPSFVCLSLSAVVARTATRSRTNPRTSPLTFRIASTCTGRWLRTTVSMVRGRRRPRGVRPLHQLLL